MEHRKTLTMNWDGLGDVDDDDAFFESYSRLSTAVPPDLASSSDEDDDDYYDNPRLSFVSAVSSAHSLKNRAPSLPDPTSDYGIWMASPASITERRKRLLHGMGLDDDKEISKARSVELDNAISKNIVNRVPSSDSGEKSSLLVASNPANVTNSDSAKKKKEQSSVQLVLVRSRSESDIDSFSIERSRKEDFLGKVSKQHITRTSTEVAFPRAGNGTRNRAIVRDSEEKAESKRSVAKLEDSEVGAFFVVRNLDTGKEFIVNECGENGMWNKLRDLQTGKKLTMEEFEKTVGKSRVVNDLMRRGNGGRSDSLSRKLSSSLRMSKRRGAALLKNIKDVASGFIGEREREGTPVGVQQSEAKSEWVRVRQSGKSHKELSALHLCQEFQAHEGCVWTIKFSLDGRYLASAGEDKLIHLWEVQECEVLRPDEGSATHLRPSLLSKKGKFGSRRGSAIPDYVHVPATVFSLSEKPICTFQGHSDDVLDLSWSNKSHLLLSSSMDKTVRLWDLETKTCLSMFAHNDYVTCIQFNPTSDDHFISGSLDAKVRIWSISERHVVDWTDIHEIVTAVSYTPDGRGALVGTHNGGCRTYSTEGCILTQTGTIEIRNKKSKLRKVTGFQFAPGNPSEILVTSADSRIRILDGPEVVQKFKGFRNPNSQFGASFSPDGRYVISASEDSQVYVWKHEERKSAGSGKGRNVLVNRSHEHFQCKDVSVAIPWPCTIRGDPPLVPLIQSKRHSKCSQSALNYEDTASLSAMNSKKTPPPIPKKSNNHATEGASNSPCEYAAAIAHTEDEDHEAISRTDSGFGFSFNSGSSSVRSGDSPSSWSSSYSFLDSSFVSSSILPSAWGLAIVTAGFGGEIRCYQNFGLPRKMSRQPHLFGGYNSFSHGNT